jgi:hypothetical protein
MHCLVCQFCIHSDTKKCMTLILTHISSRFHFLNIEWFVECHNVISYFPRKISEFRFSFSFIKTLKVTSLSWILMRDIVTNYLKNGFYECRETKAFHKIFLFISFVFWQSTNFNCRFVIPFLESGNIQYFQFQVQISLCCCFEDIFTNWHVSSYWPSSVLTYSK